MYSSKEYIRRAYESVESKEDLSNWLIKPSPTLDSADLLMIRRDESNDANRFEFGLVGPGKYILSSSETEREQRDSSGNSRKKKGKKKKKPVPSPETLAGDPTHINRSLVNILRRFRGTQGKDESGPNPGGQ